MTAASLGRVLVVEDEHFIRVFVDAALRHEGYEVVLAPDGAEALRHSVTHPPDLILLDLLLPHMTGWQFVDAYRASVQRPAPIVVMSAAGPAVEGVALELRAVDVLAKPFELVRLLETVKRHIGERN